MTQAGSTLWQCARCGRRFAKRNQWHSCAVRSLDTHFAGKDPRLRKLFDALIRRLRQSGPLRFDAVQSSINLVSKHHFGGVSVRRDYLRVGFLAETPVQDPRIIRTLRLGPRRVAHTIILRSVADLGVDVVAWLRNAQRLQVSSARTPRATEKAVLKPTLRTAR